MRLAALLIAMVSSLGLLGFPTASAHTQKIKDANDVTGPDLRVVTLSHTEKSLSGVIRTHGKIRRIKDDGAYIISLGEAEKDDWVCLGCPHVGLWFSWYKGSWAARFENSDGEIETFYVAQRGPKNLRWSVSTSAIGAESWWGVNWRGWVWSYDDGAKDKTSSLVHQL